MSSSQSICCCRRHSEHSGSGYSVERQCTSTGRVTANSGSIINGEGGVPLSLFAFFDELPLSLLFGTLMLIAIFISFTTLADSLTTTMSSLTTTGNDLKNPEPPATVKIFWGGLIGVLAILTVTAGTGGEISGIDAVKQTATLAGFPVLFLIILISFSAIKNLRSDTKVTGEPKDDQARSCSTRELSLFPFLPSDQDINNVILSEGARDQHTRICDHQSLMGSKSMTCIVLPELDTTSDSRMTRDTGFRESRRIVDDCCVNQMQSSMELRPESAITARSESARKNQSSCS